MAKRVRFDGYTTVKVDADIKGEMLNLKNTINGMVTQLHTLPSEITRVNIEVGTEGKLGGQAMVEGTTGMWKTVTDNINLMAQNLTEPVLIVAHREILDLKNTVNEMTASLSQFAAEVTRVAREVGTEGKLNGQAKVEGVQGTWKDLTDNINVMANNLTLQVRTISGATITGLSVSGEMLRLINAINDMIDQLAIFAREIKKVALEVGTKGNMGVQAEVSNVQGIWLEISDHCPLNPPSRSRFVEPVGRILCPLGSVYLLQHAGNGTEVPPTQNAVQPFPQTALQKLRTLVTAFPSPIPDALLSHHLAHLMMRLHPAPVSAPMQA
ncbi:hypothetical protein MVEN_02498500 [Mycena venus]|uniref:Uncharacterized protein n=1 Tax=Mycena venus TaxID=2733690 RepID=A0A8H7CBY6_9AGAR|nr:hypothetical protein MVEN_02498500 [Mycena venus]